MVDNKTTSSSFQIQLSEGMFQTYFDQSLVGMAITSTEKGWLYVNECLCKLLGRSFEELQTLTWADLTHPNDLDADIDKFQKLLNGDIDGYKMEKRFLHKSGQEIPTLLSVSCIRKKTGEVNYVLAQIQDLSDQKKTEQAFIASNREIEIRNQIAEIFLTVPDDKLFSAVLDIVLEATGSKHGVFGYINEKGDLVVPSMTRHIWEKCGVVDKDIVFPCGQWGDSIWPEALRKKEILYSNERSTRTPKGHIPVDRNIAAPIIHQNQAIGLLQVGNKETDYDGRDVELMKTLSGAIAPILNGRLRHDREEVRRRAYKAALEASEARYRAVVDNIPLKLFLKNNRFIYIHVNDNYASDFGRLPEDFIGKDDFAFYPENLAKKYRVDDAEVIASGKILDVEESYIADGQVYWVHTIKAPVADDSGKIIGLIGMFWDITDKKKAHEELQRLNEDLKRSNRELEQFAYVASHDLQEPLRMVASYTELLEEKYRGKLDDKADKYIGYAVEGAKRMQGLINDLLLLSRVNTRGRPFDFTDCNVLVKKVLQSMQNTIEEKQASIQTEPLPTVMGDETQLYQLFQNLIGNAIKFHAAEKPIVKIGAKQKNSTWIFSIQDNGIGIDPQFFDRIFIIFQRLHDRCTYEGTGIGLSISKKIVERHGGKIWIESEPDKGSTFYFSLPANLKPKEDDE